MGQDDIPRQTSIDGSVLRPDTSTLVLGQQVIRRLVERKQLGIVKIKALSAHVSMLICMNDAQLKTPCISRCTGLW